MDIAKSWAVGGVAALVPVFGFALAAPSQMGLAMLLSAFLGSLAAAAVHPQPSRSVAPRHLVASLPPAFTVPVFGSLAVSAHPVAPALSAGTLAFMAGQALLAGVLAIALVRLRRSQAARSQP